METIPWWFYLICGIAKLYEKKLCNKIFCDIGYESLCMEEVTSLLSVYLGIMALIKGLVYGKPIRLLKTMACFEHFMKCFEATVF